VPDAEPRLEPFRRGGPNKPYDVYGRNYVPLTEDTPYAERGLASWYGRKFQGRPTASGEIYNMYAMTAAHPTLPIPSYARIRNPANGREVVVRINDRGPFHSDRVVDLSYTAALKLDLLRGVAPVELQRITFDEIRSGAWRHDAGVEATRLATNEPPVRAEPPPATTVAAAVASPITVAATAADVASPSSAATTASSSTTATAAATATSVSNASANSTTGVVASPAADLRAGEPIGDATGARDYTTPTRGYWVQLGAFRQRDGAETFQRRVGAEADWLAPLLAVFNESATYRLQAGPYPNREAARGVAERVRAALQLVPVIVERR
jgi:rare lipoprotein A